MWIVLVRDVSEVAPVEGLDATYVSLVMDLATGLMHSAGVGASAGEARVSAMRSAVASPVEPFTGEVPQRVVCADGHGSEVRADLAAALPGIGSRLPVEEATLPPSVEEAMDDLVEHFTDRPGGPTDEEWEFLVSRTLEYAQAQPWHTWPDELQMRVELTVEAESSSYVVAVIGREGLQAGLVLYPGRDHQDVIVPDEDWEPDQPLPFRDGSLLLHLNPPDDTVEHLAALALQYGWPPAGPYMPVWLSAGPDGFAELDGAQAVRLGVALVAVLARSRQPAGRTSGPMSGTVALADGVECRYTLTDLA